jgi:protein TonB
MPRLRVTATLSLLALALGVGATQWLSDRTAGRATPPETGPRTASVHAPHRDHAHSRRVIVAARPGYDVTQAQAAVTPSPVALVPLSTPTTSLPVARTQHHTVGSLVLHLTIDGQGQVIDAAIAQSSGDAVLDANAMDIARHWLFEVPADHPQGVSGDLPMHFTGELAQRR